MHVPITKNKSFYILKIIQPARVEISQNAHKTNENGKNPRARVALN